jgi:hypothetical protein
MRSEGGPVRDRKGEGERGGGGVSGVGKRETGAEDVGRD